METESRPWRLFCALDLPTAVRDRVMKHIDRLREIVPEASASWSRESNVHLTIKFIGEVPPARAEDLSQAASRAVSDLDHFEFELSSAGSFPQNGPPKVLWIGTVDPSGKLAELHKRLDEECGRAGFAKEQRNFHPHLTIARLRKPHGARTLSTAHRQLGFEPLTVPVSELLVIRSELNNQGSRYTYISRHALK